MTRIPEEAQRVLDLDWFAVDGEGRLAHFTSLGRSLPESVAVSWEDLRQLQRYFRQSCGHRSPTRVDPGLDAWRTFASPSRRERFLRDFQALGSRGLYSYDLEEGGGGWTYRRVILPDVPLRLEDLPEALRGLLGRTARASVSFERDAVLDGSVWARGPGG